MKFTKQYMYTLGLALKRFYNILAYLSVTPVSLSVLLSIHFLCDCQKLSV